jgi:arsenate reductase (thioredoxin)
MAEGVLRAMHGDRCEVSSAGVEASQVDPRAIRAMSEIGVDTSSQHSKSMNEYRGIPFDITVTVCDRAKEVCPICGASLIAPVHTPAARKTIHKNFRDPATAEGSEEEQLAVFRQVRDEIRE